MKDEEGNSGRVDVPNFGIIRSNTMIKKNKFIDDILNSSRDIDYDKEAAKENAKRPKLIKPSDFDSYSFNIPHIELKSNVVVSQKLLYIMNEALSDLGFRNIATADFWLSLIILLLALWIRAYLHAFGSWLLLIMLGVPVTSFSPMMYITMLSIR